MNILKKWPLWVTPAAASWSLICLCGMLAAILTGHTSLFFLPGSTYSTYIVAGTLILGLGLTLAALHAPKKSKRSRPFIVLLLFIGIICLLSTVGLLLSLIELAVSGTVQDRNSNQNWPTVIAQIALLLTGVLFLGSALVWRWRQTGICPRCGNQHAFGIFTTRPAQPKTAPRHLRVIANIGCLAFLPYFTMHTLGVFGFSGTQRIYDHRPTIGMLLLLVVGIGLASFLLQGLVRPWGVIFPKWSIWFTGRRVPPALPLTPVWFIAPTLLTYGTVALGLTLLIATNQLPGYTRDETLLLGGAAAFSFATYGWALTIAAIAYWRRTRPICNTK